MSGDDRQPVCERDSASPPRHRIDEHRRAKRLLASAPGFSWLWPEPGAWSLKPGANLKPTRSLKLEALLMSSEVDALRRFLQAGRNADGGWGYYPGKNSRLEPTCWALLALPDLDPTVLTAWPVADGLLQERRSGDINFAFHALAIVALTARGLEHASGNATLTAKLEGARGIKLDESKINRQNNQLQGWSWIAGTFSWVEPTAWALLALKRAAAAGHRIDSARLTEAQALLVDRCCEHGGWNYGNANMLGKQLRPYIPTTAIGLLALQKCEHPVTEVVSRSLQYLERAATSEPSAGALSLSALALSAYSRPAEGVRTLLRDHSTRAVDLGQHLGAAMALYALEAGKADAFTL
jgi:hypothetical protein